MKSMYSRKFSRLIPLAFALLSQVALAQGTVTGRVTSDGESLPGVNVLVKGTTVGTITDADGQYSVNAALDAILVFSYVGFVTEEVPIEGRTTVDITLTPDIQTLSEIVVVGYGTQRKQDLTGAIATVSSQDFVRVPLFNPLDALAARAPGLSITSNSGMPGVNPDVLIRGRSSFGTSEDDAASKNSPIYVVDGLITTGISNYSPNDIESISVLKDASATAIYGSRAANGVILVTTKRGANKGKPTISFNSYVGFQGEGNLKREVLNSDQYIEIFTEAYENEGAVKQWTDADLDQYKDANGNYINTDWKSLIKRTGVIQNYELGVTGGNENSNYYISGGYKTNDLMIKSYDYSKLTLVVNSDHKITNWIKFGHSMNLYSTEVNGATRSLGETFWQDALTSVPIKRAYEDDGLYGYVRNSYLENGGNMLFSLANNVNNQKNIGVMGNIYLTIEPIKGLKATIKESVEWDHQYLTTFNAAAPTYLTNNVVLPNSINKAQQQTAHNITDVLIDYSKQIGSLHSVSAMFGYSAEQWKRETLEGFRSGTPNNDIQFVSAGDPSTWTNRNTFTDWAFLSMFGRLNYNFGEKYLLAATVRRDGSSRLAEGNRYGVFPGVSLGWRVSKENFMSNVPLVSDLKIRGSWGTVGSVGALSNYAASAFLDSYPYAAGQSIYPGYTLSDAINRDITWETSDKKNFGIDASLWNSHIYTTIDYYIEDTEGQLIQRILPASSGKGSNPYINAGKVRNKGIEFLLGYAATRNDWNFDANVNFSSNKNEVIDLGGASFPTQGIVEGYPIRSYFGYTTNGVIQSQADLTANPQGPLFANKKPGDVMLVDVSGNDNGELTHVPDGQITADDRWIIGRKYPKAIYGFMGSIGYKNLMLQVQLQGVSGIDRNIGTSNDYGLFHYYYRWALNHDAVILDRWHATKNPDGQWPRVDVKDVGKNKEMSDYWLRDASFLRIKNVNLNYNLPNGIVDRLKMKSFGVYFTIQNLWTFTDFPGQEVDSTVDPMTGVPQPRTYSLGLRATF